MAPGVGLQTAECCPAVDLHGSPDQLFRPRFGARTCCPGAFHFRNCLRLYWPRRPGRQDQAHDSVLATPAHPSTSPRICFAHLAESSGPAHEDHPGHNERDADDLHRAVEPVPLGRPIDPFLEAVRAEGTWTIT